jgi:SAM-dependent MidA family methyltransferase
MKHIRDIIETRIKERGPITFEEFMEIALYDPKDGYYSSGKANIGKEEDFYTSPYVHKVFGAIIADFIIKAFDLLEEQSLSIVELGAGKGVLARDILNHIKINFPDHYKHISYYSVEQSTGTVNEARNNLARHKDRVRTLSSLDEIEDGKITGVVISNEFFDALPFHRMKYSKKKLHEIFVTLEKGELVEITGNPSKDELLGYLSKLEMDFRDGQEFEINLRSKKFLTKINSILSKGLLLTIDYGYLSDELFSPERMKGTYKCLYKHTINETPYVNPGSQDITAHVDFGNLIRVGETLGFSRIIYTTQGQFLLDWGILEMIAENEEGEFSEHEIQSIKNLFLPGLMGDKFKVLIQGKNFQDAFNNFYPESPLKISFKVL